MPSKIKLNLPKQIWTKADTMRLAMDTLASIKLRTSRGIDANGTKFKQYSKKRIYISLDKGTGARLKPKGGVLSRTGKTMRFDGGYREYKNLSRKRGTVPGQTDSAEVDLVLSGSLMNNLVILKATQTRFVIGLTNNVKYYGYAVNQKREYLGLSPDDVRLIIVTARQTIADKLSK
tara:strand:+ start:2428 stop:2955 length:528 start_codon:yes stop_codon:yes gene_type:complete